MAVARTGFRRRFGMWLAEEAGTLRSDIAKFADLDGGRSSAAGREGKHTAQRQYRDPSSRISTFRLGAQILASSKRSICTWKRSAGPVLAPPPRGLHVDRSYPEIQGGRYRGLCEVDPLFSTLNLDATLPTTSRRSTICSLVQGIIRMIEKDTMPRTPSKSSASAQVAQIFSIWKS